MYGARGALELLEGYERDYSSVDCSETEIRKSTSQDVLTDQQINIYPNPATDEVTLVHGEIINPRLVIRDISGKLIMEFQKNEFESGETMFTLTELTTGIYIYELYNGEERLKAGKLIIER